MSFQRQAGAWNPITKNNLVQNTLADSDIPPIVLLKDKSDVDDGGKDTFLSGRKISTKLWEKWLTNLGKVVIIYLLFWSIWFIWQSAEVAELADAHGSGPCGSNTLWVRLPSSACCLVAGNLDFIGFPAAFYYRSRRYVWYDLQSSCFFDSQPVHSSLLFPQGSTLI